jgi:hypothetical protein
MEPYFYQFEEELLSIEDRQSLLTVARNSYLNFKLYTQNDNVNFLQFSDMVDFDITVSNNIRNLIKSCSIKPRIMIIHHRPNKPGGRHIDNPFNGRNAVISIPLYPLDIYPPTLFWDSFTSDIPIAKATYTNFYPCLFNTQKLHSVNRNDTERFNFQLCFNEKFEQVLKLIQDNKLFI